MNYMIDGDNGSDCDSPYHDGCEYCEAEIIILVCDVCKEVFVGKEDERLCPNCK